MAFKRFFLLIILGLVTCRAGAAVEGSPGKMLELPDKAIDLAVSADGRRTFVLLAEGRILVLDPDGGIESTLETGVRADRVELSRDGSRLWLNDLGSRSLHTVVLGYTYDVSAADSPFRGNSDAPVTIVVFSEFQCPHCSRLEALFSQALARFPQQVKVEFRHFPLRSHVYARHAALAAQAAHQQGKFWPLHDLLFANQNNLSPQLIQELAGRAGLDLERYQRDIRSEAVAARIDRDMQVARNAGVQGTPTLFVNGRLLQDRSVEALAAAVEKELVRSAGGVR